MIVKDAFRFLPPLLAAAVVSFWLGWLAAAIFLLLVAAFVAFFFRNPERAVWFLTSMLAIDGVT